MALKHCKISKKSILLKIERGSYSLEIINNEKKMGKITKNRELTFSLLLTLLMFLLPVPTLAADKGKGEIKFKETTHDFGLIKEDGGPVTYEFKFENTGSAPLVINSAKAECGCTKPEYPEKSIAPGATGVIKVTYNPLGRPGGFTKVVTVRTNGNPSKVNLKIRGTVNPK